MLISVTFLSAQQQNPLINFPMFSPQGNTIAFNYQGDIWTANADGSNAKRITVHQGYDTHPIWSAKGKRIAFQSDRYGNSDIFVMDAQGGFPKRLTYRSSRDLITDFTTNGAVLFNSKRSFSQVEWEPEIDQVSTAGGTPFLALNATGYDAILSPNGKMIAFVKGSCRMQRQDYRGSANRDVWIYNIKNDTYNQITTFKGNDFYPQWLDDNTLYFQSSRNGKYNIFKVKVDASGKKSGQVEAISSFKDMGIFSFSLNRFSKKIATVVGDKLYEINPLTKAQHQIHLTIGTDYRFDPVQHKTYTKKVSDLVISPDGKNKAMIIRGELFVSSNEKDVDKTVNLTKTAARERSPQWLNNNTLIFVSDRAGQNDLYLVKPAEPALNMVSALKFKTQRLTNSKDQENNPVLSPDKKHIAFVRGRGQLVVVAIDVQGKLSTEKILLNGWDTPGGISWSPDSKWLAYSLSDLDFNEEIYIRKADNSNKPINISMHPKADRNPLWSADGKKIVWSSNRDNGDFDVWFAWLKKADFQKTKQDWADEDFKNKNLKKDKKDKKDTKKVIVTIDTDNIYQRQVKVTSFAGGEFAKAISKDGKTIYYTTGNGGRGSDKVNADLYKINWDGTKLKALTKKNKRPKVYGFDTKFKYLYYTAQGGKVFRIDAKSDKSSALAFKAKMDIDFKKEANQIFEEAWHALNEGFYDPNFHGYNWVALKKQYKPLALKASTRVDFKAIFNWMLGQLNASHMGMYRGEDRKVVQKEKTGLLGISVKQLKSGAVKILSVTPDMPADKDFSKLKIGEQITTVNGTKLTKNTNLYQLLNGTVNQKVVLQLKSNDGKMHQVVIRPKDGNRKENYEAWVKERKRLTKKYSGGQLGYIHIQGMNWTSFEHFERELTAAGLGKKGVVIDVRFNGGGWTTDYLMAVLTVKQHAYTIPRGAAKNLAKEQNKFVNYYPFSERLPLAPLMKPSIALCNQNSYSNAEIFSHAYKHLGIGTLVGVPTFGAVISTGGHTLIDGSYVRMPFRGWYVKATRKNMEHGPAVPDIMVKNAPDDKAKRKDTQLQTAVKTLLKQIK